MDEALGEKLGAILSDPQQMEQIGRLAMQLMGPGAAADSPAAPDTPAEQSRPDSPGAMTGLGGMLGNLMGAGGQSKSEALLLAMRPYLRPGRQEKLEKALRISRMLHLAGTVMKQYGGESFGL